MERHGLRRPSATAATYAVGRLSPMAFLVGVTCGARLRSPPPDAFSDLDGGRIFCARGDRRPSRGRIALPPPGGGATCDVALLDASEGRIICTSDHLFGRDLAIVPAARAPGNHAPVFGGMTGSSR